MSCSFSKEFLTSNYTNVENVFIKEYLPGAPGEAVKVYLYGLYLCSTATEQSLEEIASALSINEETVRDCFDLWESYGLVSVINKDPFSVVYLPVSKATYQKPRRYKKDKYSDFNKSLQYLLPQRMISPAEYTEYHDIMEQYAITQDAMLLIVKYCIDKKGENISSRYIYKVAQRFGEEKTNTLEKIEKKLASYVQTTNFNLTLRIIKALGVYTEINDNIVDSYTKKWLSYGFTDQSLLLIATQLLKANKNTLSDMNFLVEKLYKEAIIDYVSINDYFESKKEVSVEEYNREYARRRALAVSVAQKNCENAMELEGFSKLYERIFSIEKDLAFAEISGNTESLKLLEKEKVTVTEKAQEILKEIALTLDDLSPKYACEKCKDTGYVGTHKCDCFKTKK